MPLKRQWINMHHWSPRLKWKKTTAPGSVRIHKSSKCNEGWLRKDGSKSKQHQDLLDHKHINSRYKKHLHHYKKTYILSKLNDNKNKTRNLYKTFKSLTKLEDENPMPPTESPSDLPNKLADFFLNKIKKMREQFCDQNIHNVNTIGNAQNSLGLCL